MHIKRWYFYILYVMERLEKISPPNVNNADWQASIIADKLDSLYINVLEQKLAYPHDSYILIDWNNKIELNKDVVHLLKWKGWYVYEEIYRSRYLLHHKLLISVVPIGMTRIVADCFKRLG
jgi:hypothetical protein